MNGEPLHERLERLFTEHRRALVGAIARIVGNSATAEELAHDAYLRVAAAAVDRPVDSPRAFLFRTARNLAIDHVRRARLERGFLEPGLDDEALHAVPGGCATPEDIVRHRQSLAILDDALSDVPDRARRVLILNRLHGWSLERIAVHLGVSTTTVHKDFRRALAACLAAAEKGGLL